MRMTKVAATLDGTSLPDDWTDEQREVFGKVYRFMQLNQDTHCHPGMLTLSDEHWQTICYNSAFLAASVVGGENLTICDDDERVLATTETAKLNG